LIPPFNVQTFSKPSFLRVSPAFLETFPLSQTNTINLSLFLISFDLLAKSLEGIFFDAVICPVSKDEESLTSIINALS